MDDKVGAGHGGRDRRVAGSAAPSPSRRHGVVRGVGLVARSGAELDEVLAAIGGAGAVAVADVAARDEVADAIRSIEAALGGVDILVANAGIGAYGPFADLDVDDIERLVQVNVLGTVYPIKAVLPGMIERRRGHIAVISSVAGTVRVAVRRGVRGDEVRPGRPGRGPVGRAVRPRRRRLGHQPRRRRHVVLRRARSPLRAVVPEEDQRRPGRRRRDQGGRAQPARDLRPPGLRGRRRRAPPGPPPLRLGHPAQLPLGAGRHAVSRFPFPIPTGWFPVARSGDVAPGEGRPVRFFSPGPGRVAQRARRACGARRVLRPSRRPSRRRPRTEGLARTRAADHRRRVHPVPVPRLALRRVGRVRRHPLQHRADPAAGPRPRVGRARGQRADLRVAPPPWRPAVVDAAIDPGVRRSGVGPSPCTRIG